MDRALTDHSIVIDKSRPKFSESQRLKKTRDTSNSNEEENDKRDEEVYDDVQFYSLLLKVTICFFSIYIYIFLMCCHILLLDVNSVQYSLIKYSSK